MDNNKLIVTRHKIPGVESMIGDCQSIYTDGLTWTSWGTFLLNDPRVFGLVIANEIETDRKFWDGRKGNKINLVLGKFTFKKRG